MVALFCMIIISGLNMASFYIQDGNQDVQRKNYINISWCLQTKKYINLMLSNNGLYNSVIAGHYAFNDPEDKSLILKKINETNQMIFNQYKNLTQTMIQSEQQEINVFNQAINYEIDHIFPYTLEQNVNNIIFHPKNISTSLASKLIYFQNYAYYILNFLDEKNNNYINAASANIQSVLDALNDIFEKNIQYYYYEIDNTKIIIAIQLVSIASVTCTFSILIIPIYAYFMKKKQDILKLFATIPQNKVVQMMEIVDKYQNKDIILENNPFRQKSIHQQSTNHSNGLFKFQQTSRMSVKQPFDISSNQIIFKKNFESMKKKVISQTSTIKKINSTLIIFILICLSITTFYPIANYIVILTQVNNFHQNIDFINDFDQFIDNFTQMISYKYQYTYQLKQNVPSQTIENNLQIRNTIISQTSDLQKNLIDAFTKISDYDGYNSEDYKTFLIPVFKDDTCETLFIIDTDHNQDEDLDHDRCIQTYEGIFKKGLFVVLKQTITIFEQFFEAVFSKDSSRFNQMLENLYKIQSISDEYNFFLQILQVSNIIHNFFQDYYELYHEYIDIVQTKLLSAQLITIFTIIILIWKRFYDTLNDSLNQAQQFLDLIDINTLIDNPYVISHFKINK